MRKMMDYEGDIWEEQEEGDWLWDDGECESYLPSIESLERLFGPLTEVTED
jgi:hypothetical protein